jgi:hypothetical protein
MPQACAVCACARKDAKLKVHFVSLLEANMPIFDILCIPEMSLVFGSPPFQFGHPALNNVMLCDAGMSEIDGGWEIRICDWCNTQLAKRPEHMPKFALKGNLYCGSLPEHLKDLSWVEEQVCALVQWLLFNRVRECANRGWTTQHVVKWSVFNCVPRLTVNAAKVLAGEYPTKPWSCCMY